MKFRLLFFTPWLAACAQFGAAPSLERMPAKTDFAASIVEDIPNRSAFKGWKDRPHYVSSPVEYDKLQKVPFRCETTTLYPTHPQQTLKKYHVFRTGNYDHHKLQADDEACALATPRPNPAGRRFCLRPDYLEYAIVSDLYEDECGNFYRGYKEVLFLKKNESMGSLFSAGRATFQDPRSSDPREMVDAHTYAVDLKEFLFLTEPFAGEIEKSRALRGEALSRTHRYDAKTRTFVRRND